MDTGAWQATFHSIAKSRTLGWGMTCKRCQKWQPALKTVLLRWSIHVMVSNDICFCTSAAIIRVCVCVCVCVCTQSCLILFDLMDCSHQAPLSVEFPRQEYWSGLPFPPPRDLPNSGIEPTSLAPPSLVGRCFTHLCHRWLQASHVTSSTKWGTRWNTLPFSFSHYKFTVYKLIKGNVAEIMHEPRKA